MRGYDALILVDISRQGGEPGTLYVMEPDEDDIAAGIEDGEMIDPHGMDPQTVLRFVQGGRRLAGQGRRRRLRAGRGRGDGTGLSAGQAAVDRAVELVRETVDELRCESYRCTSSRSPARSSTPSSATPPGGA